MISARIAAPATIVTARAGISPRTCWSSSRLSADRSSSRRSTVAAESTWPSITSGSSDAEAKVDCGERGDRPGHADQLAGGVGERVRDHLGDRRSQRPDGAGGGGEHGEESLRQPHAADVEADLVDDPGAVAQHELGRAAADVADQRARGGRAAGRSRRGRWCAPLPRRSAAASQTRSGARSRPETPVRSRRRGRRWWRPRAPAWRPAPAPARRSARAPRARVPGRRR